MPSVKYVIQVLLSVTFHKYIKQLQENSIPNAYHLPILTVNFLNNVHKYTKSPNMGFTRNNRRRYSDGQITSKYGVKEMSLPHSGRQAILYNPYSLYEWNYPQKSGDQVTVIKLIHFYSQSCSWLYPGHFIRSTYWTVRCAGYQSKFEHFGKISCLFHELNPKPPFPWSSHYTDCTFK
jgi:hypothetical protein